MSRHDGPLSVLRAYSAEEMRGLCAERAGLPGVAVRRYRLRCGGARSGRKA